MGKLFILLGIHVIVRRRVQRRLGGGGGERNDNSPTSKIYTTWVRISSDRNCTLKGGGETAGSNAPGAFVFFFGGHLPQTSGFRLAKQIRDANF